jgi:hypothetical protein
MSEQLLRPAEAAKKLAKSIRWLRLRRASGEIPAVGSGRGVRYAVSDLDAWISRQKSLNRTGAPA